ncbi:MAG: signal peptide peptidase SppA [Elusimicrobiaceae bacterium]|nr:signal peptide peptidase SppA [Elusimicrobiaceae bacterium]
MSEKENASFPDSTSPGVDTTSTGLPTEWWEQKLKENEKTILLTNTSQKKKETPAHTSFAPRSIWASLLLLTFIVSTCCGLFLASRPAPVCATKAEDKREETSDASFVSSLAKSAKSGIAWIKVRGVISQDDNNGPFSRPQGASAIAKRIRQAAEDKNVKAIVLDINSPGGTVASVQNIYGELLKAKEQGKKIVALMRDVAASGGFYIAMAADKIVAEPGTITGSVGVIMQTGNVEGLFEKIGVKVTPITSGKYKDMGSAYRPMTDAEKAILQDMVNDTYAQFFAAVKAGRPGIKPEDLMEYTDGRVFTGQRAYNIGFIDKLGGEEEARLLAGELAGIKDPKVISQRGDGLRDFILSLGSNVESRSVTKQLQTLTTPSVSYLWVN